MTFADGTSARKVRPIPSGSPSRSPTRIRSGAMAESRLSASARLSNSATKSRAAWSVTSAVMISLSIRDMVTTTVRILAEPWVRPQTRKFYAVGKAEPAGTEHSSLPIELEVR